MRHFFTFIFLIFLVNILYGQDDKSKSSAMFEVEIARLKQIILKKDEEIKILLMALKNGEAEKYASLSSQKLDFKKVQVLTPTKVVLKADGLSETAIAEIDQSSKIYKEFVPVKEEVLAPQPEPILQNRLIAKNSVVVPEEKEPEIQKEEEEDDEQETPPPPPIVIPQVQEEPEPEMVEKTLPPKREQRRVIGELPQLTYMQPSKYKILMMAPVYQNIGGEMDSEWEVGKTFTSNRRRGKWIMITGIITDKGWVKSPTTLWIQESFIKKVR